MLKSRGWLSAESCRYRCSCRAQKREVGAGENCAEMMMSCAAANNDDCESRLKMHWVPLVGPSVKGLNHTMTRPYVLVSECVLVLANSSPESGA